MVYVLIRDGNGDLHVMPVDVFDMACKDGTLHPETEPIYEGECEDCLMAMDALSNEGKNGGN